MYRQLLFTIVFCSFLVTILSIQCYVGTDRQCMLTSHSNQCYSNSTCYCIKYRFPCTHNDQACNKYEEKQYVKKWHYDIVSEEVCGKLKNSKVYEDIICCSTDGCNRPDTGKCSWSQSRRRAMRKLTDLLDF